MAVHRLSASRPFIPAFLFTNEATAEVVALIDTGASMTAIRPDLIERMGAIKIGSELFTQVGTTPRRVPTYYFTLRLGPDSHEFAIKALAVAPASSCDVLIGRDLLSRWVLAWDGPADRLLISY
jgi:predicted aspartyl protease